MKTKIRKAIMSTVEVLKKKETWKAVAVVIGGVAYVAAQSLPLLSHHFKWFQN